MRKGHNEHVHSGNGLVAEPTEPEPDAVTPGERRQALEALGAAAARDDRVVADARVLEVLARGIVEPRAEFFAGEAQTLVAVLIDEQDGHSFAVRALAQAAIEVADEGEAGSAAARLSMLRGVASLLLHQRCTRMVTADRRGGES